MHPNYTMYYIWFDESDKEGKYYSNFYGGILVKSENLSKVLEMSNTLVNELGLQNEEIKWQKVNAYTFERYLKIADFIFDLLKHKYAKIRIFFRNNQYVPEGLTSEQKRKTYPKLYYQFIKHSFGLQYSNNTGKDIYIKIMLDDIPLKGEDSAEFKNYIYGLNNDKGFKDAHIKIRHEDICEVDSSKHILLQFMDLILGAICFRLNDKHKEKDAITGKRGKRTILKEKLYKHINSKIRELHPGFNIGVSTGMATYKDKWECPYSHWSFKPSSSIRDLSKAKKRKSP